MTTSGIPPAGRTGSSNDQLRRANLSTILTAIHRTGGRSRAELVQSTGLTRSSIAGLVSELSELGLVTEGLPENQEGRVGRPSLQVLPNDRVAALAIAPDVDAVTIGLVGLGGEVHRRIRYDTPRTPSVADVVNISKAVIAGLRGEIDDGYRVLGVGVAVPGLVRASTGRVLIAPHLGWRDQAITGPLAKALGYPVWAGNDASVGALAETNFGAARGVQDLVYLNGSDRGIGGGLIIGGQTVHGTDGYAGELGHTLVNSAGTRCHCGRIGCLETEVSLARLLGVLGMERGDQDELDVALGITRDPRVLAEVRREIELLSEALSNFVNLFNPELVLLGGFLGSLLSVGRERLVAAVRERSIATLGQEVRIERAKLRANLSVVGAAELVFEHLLSDPAAAKVGTPAR